MASARNPIARDSPSAMTPRITGRRQIGCRTIGDSIGWLTCAISPSGLRTATAQLDGPRIITPSRTACPPTVVKALLAFEPASVGVGRRASSRLRGLPALRRSSSTGHFRRKHGLSADGCHEGVRLAAAGAAGLLQPALEPLDPAAGVDELLLAGVERMAVRADLDMELGLPGTRLERVPAGARDGCEDVFGVNVRLHLRLKPG